MPFKIHPTYFLHIPKKWKNDIHGLAKLSMDLILMYLIHSHRPEDSSALPADSGCLQHGILETLPQILQLRLLNSDELLDDIQLILYLLIEIVVIRIFLC